MFNNFKLIDGLVRTARTVEFSFPLEGGGFRLLRFDLHRSSEAIATMEARARQAMNRRAPIAAPEAMKGVLWDM